MRWVAVAILAFVPAVVSATGISGATELRCDAKDGTEYVVNANVFPQGLEVNAEWLELRSIKNESDGFKHYAYGKGYEEEQIELKTKRGRVFLVESKEILPCSVVN